MVGQSPGIIGHSTLDNQEFALEARHSSFYNQASALDDQAFALDNQAVPLDNQALAFQMLPLCLSVPTSRL